MINTNHLPVNSGGWSINFLINDSLFKFVVLQITIMYNCSVSDRNANHYKRESETFTRSYLILYTASFTTGN